MRIAWLLLLTHLAFAGENTYRVKPYETLGEIATRLYGTTKYVKKIIEWNQLQAPFIVWSGKKLTLEEAPTLTPEQGEKAVLNMWRKRFALKEEHRSTPSIATPTIEKKTPAVKVAATQPSGPIQGDAADKIIDELKTPSANDNRPTPHELTAKQLIDRGREYLVKKDYSAALTSFDKSEELDPAALAPQLYKIQTLKAMNKKQEAQKTLAFLLQKHPELKDLPAFKSP